MNMRLSNLALGVGLLALSVLCFLQTYEVRNFPGTRFGAEIWPRAILVCLAGLSLVLIVQHLRARESAQDSPAWREVLGREAIALSVFAAFAAFLWLVPRAGAYPSGGVFVMAVLSILGPKTGAAVLRHAAISVLASVTLWLVFSKVLHVLAPGGRWWSALVGG